MVTSSRTAPRRLRAAYLRSGSGRYSGCVACLNRAGCEAERASLRVAADRPPLARVDDLASELDHPHERGRNVRHLEVRERYAVTRARAAGMDAELGSAPVRLDAGSLSVAPSFQLHSEELLPEAPRPLEVVGGELDQLEHVRRLKLLGLDADELDRAREALTVRGVVEPAARGQGMPERRHAVELEPTVDVLRQAGQA